MNKYYYVGLVYFKHQDVKSVIGNKTYPMKSFKSTPGDSTKEIVKCHKDLINNLYYDNISLFEAQEISMECVINNARIFKGFVMCENKHSDPITFMGNRLNDITKDFRFKILGERKVEIGDKPEKFAPGEQITGRFNT